MSDKFVLIEISNPKSGRFHASEHEPEEIQTILYDLIKQDPTKVHTVDNEIFERNLSINIPKDLEAGYYVVQGEILTDDDDNPTGIRGRFVHPLAVFESMTVEEPEEKAAPEVMYA